MVALWKRQHKLLLQHITSRGFRLALRHPLTSSSAQWGQILCPPSPFLPLLLYQRVLQDWGTLVDSPCWILQDPCHPLGLHLPLLPLVAPTNWAICALLTPSLTHKNSMQFFWCALALLHRLSPANHRDRIRLFRGVYCLNDESAWWWRHAHTEAWLSAANQDVNFFLNGAHRTQSWAFFALWSRGDSSRCYLY